MFESSIGKKKMSMEFKTQVCTTQSQSERLLKMGLKKETADMCWTNASTEGPNYRTNDFRILTDPYTEVDRNWLGMFWRGYFKIVPAWSLHRLIAILGNNFKAIVVFEDPYEWVIDTIEETVKDGSILKEYLEEKE